MDTVSLSPPAKLTSSAVGTGECGPPAGSLVDGRIEKSGGSSAADRDARSAVAVGAAAGLRRRRGGRQRPDRGAGPPGARGDALLCAGFGLDRDRHDAARRPHPDEIERSLYEVDHVARAFEEIDLAPAEIASTSSTTTAASPRWRWPTASTRPSCTRCTGSSRPDRGLLRPPRAQGGAGRHQPGAAGIGAARIGPVRGDPQPDRRVGLAAAGAQGRLSALDRQDDTGEGPHRAIAAARAGMCRWCSPA